MSKDLKKYNQLLQKKLNHLKNGGLAKTEKYFGRGGSRVGAGRPKQFQEPTTINFKCELSDKVKLKERYGKELNKMFNAWVQLVLK